MSSRLFVPPERLHTGAAGLESGYALAVEGSDFRYLARVLRLRAGDVVTLFDGTGHEARARVASVDLELGRMTLSVEPSREARPDQERLPVILIAALLKGERMDWVIQKATELGVTRLVPVTAARSVVRLDAPRATARVSRWKAIAREAARQCGRTDIPVIDNIAPFIPTLAEAPGDAWKALLYEEERGTTLRGALPQARPTAAVIAVGPEGGLEDTEVDAARAAGYAIVGFGPRVLRAETASIAALAVIGFALGDLG